MRILALALLGLALPSSAAAASFLPRLDHRDQTSITVTPGFEHLVLSGRKSTDRSVSEPGAFADLAFGLPLSDEGGEGLVGLRIGTGPDEGTRLVAPWLGYRGFAGYEEWKTFFDVGAFARFLPVWGAGARLGVGLQYELSEFAGVFLATGGSVAYGDGLQIGYDVGLGLQLRFGDPG